MPSNPPQPWVVMFSMLSQQAATLADPHDHPSIAKVIGHNMDTLTLTRSFLGFAAHTLFKIHNTSSHSIFFVAYAILRDQLLPYFFYSRLLHKYV